MLCLPGVNSEDLQNILDFVYNGEIQILQNQLDQFLNIAQRFQLEGLSQGEDENNPESQHQLSLAVGDYQLSSLQKMFCI